MSENRCEDCPNVGQCDGCKLRDCETKLYDMTVERDDLQGTLNLIEHMQEGENLRYTIRAAEAKAEQIDERTLLSVRACSNLSNEQLRTAADARTDGLFKFKQKCEAEAKSLREALVVAERVLARLHDTAPEALSHQDYEVLQFVRNALTQPTT